MPDFALQPSHLHSHLLWTRLIKLLTYKRENEVLLCKKKRKLFWNTRGSNPDFESIFGIKSIDNFSKIEGSGFGSWYDKWMNSLRWIKSFHFFGKEWHLVFFFLARFLTSSAEVWFWPPSSKYLQSRPLAPQEYQHKSFKLLQLLVREKRRQYGFVMGYYHFK